MFRDRPPVISKFFKKRGGLCQCLAHLIFFQKLGTFAGCPEIFKAFVENTDQFGISFFDGDTILFTGGNCVQNGEVLPVWQIAFQRYFIVNDGVNFSVIKVSE